VVRAYVQHGMHTRPGPLRLTLMGPMFRYDRPQAGRYRQFTQWDVEVIGDVGPVVDADPGTRVVVVRGAMVMDGYAGNAEANAFYPAIGGKLDRTKVYAWGLKAMAELRADEVQP
jgi:hypothetical protein